MKPYTAITSKIKNRIAEELGRDTIASKDDRSTTYDRDASGLRHAPDLVVRARSREQVQRLLILANQYGFPVIPRGGGTGLAGGCLALHGGVVLSVEEMDQIRCIDRVDLVAEVEPGVVTQTLRERVREQGLFYPPDPAGMEHSTIGGNAATNAGGPACVKYGTTKEYILGLEAVLPSGRLIKTGVKTRKGVVGYDMTHLLVGSEGTLGVITGLTLKLIPHPPAVKCIGAVFADLRTTMQAVAEILTRGHLPSAMEFMDHRCLALVGDMLPFSIPGGNACLLIVETDGVPEQIGREIDRIGDLCRNVGATHLLPAPDKAERERIWNVRRQVSLRIHDHAPIYVPEDVAVPIGRIADLVAALPEFEAAYGVAVYAFGHAGDGNIHLNFTADRGTDMARVEDGVAAVLERVLTLDGTISGEHGIGEAKMRYLPMELSEESIRLQKGIKRLFDPNMILNPGKIFV